MPAKKENEGMTLKRPADKQKEAEMEAFINEAGAAATEINKSNLPWEQEGVNEKVIRPFNLRLNEPYSLKVEFIAENMPQYKSKHDFCMQAVLEKVDQELAKLLK